MRIGELAELAGVTTRAVRHYHRIGLLPEPARSANGYRSYDLRDAVRLVRVRRLVELGLNLDEVADALTDEHSHDLREILSGLQADLAAQEARIRAHRERIQRLLADEGDITLSAELAATLRMLSQVAGPDHPGLEREALVLQLLEPLGGSHAPDIWRGYQSILGEPAVAVPFLDAMRRFEELAELAPDDPAVDELAEQSRDIVAAAVCAAMPEVATADPPNPRSAQLLLTAVSTDLAPAQARCLELMFHGWQREVP